jgi:hypothetical protein
VFVRCAHHWDYFVLFLAAGPRDLVGYVNNCFDKCYSNTDSHIVFYLDMLSQDLEATDNVCESWSVEKEDTVLARTPPILFEPLCFSSP